MGAPLFGSAPTVYAAQGVFVQEAAARVPSGPASSVSFPSANRPGDLLVVYVVWSNTSDVTVTDTSGNVYAPVGAPVAWNGGQARAAVFYAANVVGGSNTVTARFGTPVNTFGIVYAHEYANVATTAPVEATISATGSGPAMSSGTLNTSTPGDLVFVGGASAAAMHLTSSYSVRSSGWDNVTADATGVAPGAQSVTGFQNGSGWVLQLVAFKPASGATTHHRRTRHRRTRHRRTRHRRAHHRRAHHRRTHDGRARDDLGTFRPAATAACVRAGGCGSGAFGAGELGELS